MGLRGLVFEGLGADPKKTQMPRWTNSEDAKDAAFSSCHQTPLYWVYNGIMKKKMETTIVYLGYIGFIMG